MNCHRARKSLIKYKEGKLSPERHKEMEEHLASCGGCASIAEKLERADRALSSLERMEPTDAASDRMLNTLRETGRAKRAVPFGLLRSPQTIGIAAGVAAVLVAVVIFVGLYTGDTTKKQGTQTTAVGKVAEDQAATPDSSKLGITTTPSGEKSMAWIPNASAINVAPPPVVTITETNYTPETVRLMFDSLATRKALAQQHTMVDAIDLGPGYTRKAVDDFMKLGGDGPVCEAMISYATAAQPALLPYYVEKALFNGQEAIIIGLAGPPRSGDDVKLTRTEVWVMNPQKFAANPDSGLLFFLELK